MKKSDRRGARRPGDVGLAPTGVERRPNPRSGFESSSQHKKKMSGCSSFRATDGIRIDPSPEKEGEQGLPDRHFFHSRTYSRSQISNSSVSLYDLISSARLYCVPMLVTSNSLTQSAIQGCSLYNASISR